MTKSESMARVRQRDTEAEVLIRRAIWKAGARFRLHDKRLPGTPDIVFAGKRVAVFVHGCFWHGHDCPRGRRPQSNTVFWSEKIDKNEARDAIVQDKLRALGWNPVVIWGCEAIDDAVGRVLSVTNSAPH